MQETLLAHGNESCDRRRPRPTPRKRHLIVVVVVHVDEIRYGGGSRPVTFASLTLRTLPAAATADLLVVVVVTVVVVVEVAILY